MNYTIDELKVLVKPIAKKYGIKTVYLFGSRARGDYTENSDYDFCIIPSKHMSIIKLSGFRLNLVDALQTDVDIVCEKYLEEEFRRRVETERILLYQKS